ncbi:MAG: hypothetical protein MK108_12655 [Mariniblastus sp.]|nr:hypothetical protein [Mariniblastus sp.]
MKRRKHRSRRSDFKAGKASSRNSRFYASWYFIIAALLAVLFATGILATRLRVEAKNRQSQMAEARNPERSFSELELALQSGEKQRLIDVMDQFKIEPGEEFAVQLDKIQKRLKVSEELLAIDGDPEARQMGVLSGLDALTLWHTLNVVHQLDDPLMQTKMEELAGKHVQDPDRKVAARANYVLALVETHQFILNKDPQIFQQGLKHYTSTLENVDDDLVEAIRLSNLASLLSQTGNDEEVRQMWGAFYRRFEGAENKALQALAMKAYDQYVFSGSPVTVAMEKIIRGDLGAVAGFQEQVDALVSSHDLSDSGFDKLLAMLEVLVQNGQISEVQQIARSLLDRLPEISSMAVEESVRHKIGKTLGRASLMGEKIGFQGLAIDPGGAFDASVLDDSQVILVFWSPDNERSMERLANVHKMVNLFDAGRVRLIALQQAASLDSAPVGDEMAVGGGSASPSPQPPNSAEFMTSLPNCKFMEVRPGDSQMQDFLKRLGPPFLPYIVMVDANHQIIALNPGPDYLVQALGGRQAERSRGQ